MKIQKRDVRNLMAGMVLAKKQPDKYEQHFTYACGGKNIRAIRDEVDGLNEAEKEKLEKYNEAVDKLNEECALKSEKGNIVMSEKGVTLDPEMYYRYNKEMEKLNKKFKKDIEENKAFLKEEIEIDLHLVDNKYFPPLRGDIADYLFPIRKDIFVEEKEEAEMQKEQEEKEIKKK